MSVTLIIVAIVAVAFLIALVFSHDFRVWLGDTLTAIGLLILDVIPGVATWLRDTFLVIARIVGIYSIVLGIVATFALILIIIALLINAPGFTAFAFVLAISLVLLAWMPAGIILKVFRVNTAVVPGAMKTFIAWVAFVGFLGLTLPEVLSFKSLMGAALVAFILMGITTKINALDKIILPLVLIMCLTIGWKHFFPDNFRSTTRYAVSWGKRIDTIKDRGSINNETDAATTYGVVLRDVNTLYELKNSKKGEPSLTEELRDLKRGTIVKFTSHKQEVEVIDGQGFVQITLAKANGSFVNGEKRFIEAEFVEIAAPRDITPKDASLLPKNQQSINEPSQSNQQSIVQDSVFTQGTYIIDVKGETPFNIVVVPTKIGCARYSLASPSWNYQILIPGMPPVAGSPTAQLPYRDRPTFRLASQQGDQVVLTVS